MDEATVTAGRRADAATAGIAITVGRAGRPAARRMPAKAAAATTATAPTAAREDGTRAEIAAPNDVARTTPSTGRAAQTIVSAASSATFVANSVVCGAIRSDREQRRRRPRRRAALRAALRHRLRVRDHEEEEDQDLRREHEHPPEASAPVIGPRCQRAVIACPLAASTPDACREREPEADRDPQQVEPAEDREAAGDDEGEGERQPGATSAPTRSRAGSARVAAEHQEAEHEPEVRRVEDVPARGIGSTYFESSETAAVPGEDPPAVQAPPVAVLGARDAEDERDAVAGQERARRPHDHVLPAEGDRDLEHRAGEERDEDLRDREPEVERDLAEDLERDDHRRELEARVAQPWEHNGVEPVADPQNGPGRANECGRAHRAILDVLTRCRPADFPGLRGCGCRAVV